MEDKYFKAAGDLDDGKKLIYPKKETDYFKSFKKPEEMVDYFGTTTDLESESKGFRPLGDIREDGSDLFYPKKETDDFTPFRTPQEIVDYFRPAGDLEKITRNEVLTKIEKREENKIGTLSLNDINEYLLTVVSGKRYASVCELGVLMGSGRMIASLGQIRKMVDEGYNIVSATVINAAADMIEVEYQMYKYDKELMARRSRF